MIAGLRMSLLAVSMWAAPLFAAPPKDLDATVARIMKQGGTPGLAIGIVEHGRVTWAKGYGVRQLGRPEPVDADTLFQIGSVSKAFTTASLALLVDEGKIGWDDKVIDHLPEFQMYDPWVTREFTIRDLLVHRSGLGLGAGDLTFVPRTDITRAEVVRALRWLKPQTSFRTSYAYDNLLYTVAGQLIERVTGKSWEDFVRERLLRPAGMAGSTTNEPARFRNPDRAKPHARLGPPIRGAGEQARLDETKGLAPNAYPAGGIMSSASEMTRWIALQLAHGKLPDGKPLWSERQSLEMWSPVTPLPITPAPGAMAPTTPQFSGYALGWFVQDYHGEKIVAHSGGTLGFLTRLVLVPGKDVGFIILQNSEDPEVFAALQYVLLDHYLGRPKSDWGSIVHRLFEERREKGVAALAKAQKPERVVPPSLPLASFAGDYVDSWYGGMRVTAKGDALGISFLRTPGMVGDLVPYTGDTFLARWRDQEIEPAYVTFATTPEGKVERVRMKAASPLADFSYDYHDLDFVPRPTAK